MILPNTQELIERSIYHNLRYTTVAAGYIPDITNYDIENPDINVAIAENTRFETDLKAIVTDKGFAIELFSNGPSQQRGELKVPRIVLETESFLPGEIGLDTTKNYSKNQDGTFTAYDNTWLTQTSDFYFQLRLLSNSAKQQRILNGIMLQTLPRKGYMRWVGDTELRTTGNLFINFVSHAEFNHTEEGIIEKVYRYEIKDVNEIDPVALQETIAAIQSIDPDSININIQ